MPTLIPVLSATLYVSMCVLVTQSCPTLCHPMDCSPPGSFVHGIFQARILEWMPCPPPEDLPNPGIESTFPAMGGRFLPLSHQRSLKSSNWWLYTWPFLRPIDFINNTKITISKGGESTPENEWMNQQTNIWQKYTMSIHLPNIYWVCSIWQATYQDMGNRWNNETLSLATRMSYLAEVARYTNNSGAE